MSKHTHPSEHRETFDEATNLLDEIAGEVEDEREAGASFLDVHEPHREAEDTGPETSGGEHFDAATEHLDEVAEEVEEEREETRSHFAVAEDEPEEPEAETRESQAHEHGFVTDAPVIDPRTTH